MTASLKDEINIMNTYLYIAITSILFWPSVSAGGQGGFADLLERLHYPPLSGTTNSVDSINITDVKLLGMLHDWGVTPGPIIRQMYYCGLAGNCRIVLLNEGGQKVVGAAFAPRDSRRGSVSPKALYLSGEVRQGFWAGGWQREDIRLANQQELGIEGVGLEYVDLFGARVTTSGRSVEITKIMSLPDLKALGMPFLPSLTLDWDTYPICKNLQSLVVYNQTLDSDFWRWLSRQPSLKRLTVVGCLLKNSAEREVSLKIESINLHYCRSPQLGPINFNLLRNVEEVGLTTIFSRTRGRILSTPAIEKVRVIQYVSRGKHENVWLNNFLRENSEPTKPLVNSSSEIYEYIFIPDGK